MSYKIVRYIWIVLGAAIYSMGVSLFLEPNNLVPGGLSGLCIILNYVTKVKTGTWFFLLNVPLILLGFWKFGLKFIISTSFAIVMISWFTNLFSTIESITKNSLLAAIGGAFLVAVGMGIIFKAGATTGGSDIVVKLLRGKLKYLKTGKIYLITDTIIVSLSGIIFRDFDIALYSGIAVMVNSMILDLVLYGKDEANMVFIVSDYTQNITNSILNELEVGVTYLNGQGAYTNTDKNVILCVLRKQQYPKLEEIVKKLDPRAFLIIGSASEIYGEGYKDLYSDKI